MSVPAETLGAPVVSTSPDRRLVAVDAPSSPAAEQYRVLQQRLARLAGRRPLRVVAVTSSTRGEGRTTTAANLALTAAQERSDVVLVECDLRKPSLSRLFDLVPRAGLAELLEGTVELAQALCRFGDLSVVCAGEARDPAAALRSPRMGPLLEAIRASYGFVVLDVPPALAFADADRLAAAADGALLVVRAQATPRAVVRLALEWLGDRAVGIVLNEVDANGSLHARYLYGDAPAA